VVFDVRILLDHVSILVAYASIRDLQYRDPEMVQKVKDATGNKISHVLDAVSGSDTQFTSVKILAEDKPGKVVLVQPHVDGIQNVRKDVQVTSSSTFPPLPLHSPRPNY